MNMKKIITLVSAALVLLASIPANAQGSFGAGYLSSTVVSKTGSSSSESSPMNGFYAGIGYTVPIAGALNLTPGLYYGFATKDLVNLMEGVTPTPVGSARFIAAIRERLEKRLA